MSFGIDSRKLKKIFELYSPKNHGQQLKFMLQLRGQEQLYINLQTCPFQGISQSSLQDRKTTFGNNQLELSLPSFFSILFQAINAPFIICPIIASIVIFLILIIDKEHRSGYHLVQVFVALAITFFNWLVRSLQGFFSVQKLKQTAIQIQNSKLYKVIRDNQIRQVRASQLTVGDMLDFSKGQTIPADGWMVDGIDVKVFQQHLGEKIEVRKNVFKSCILQLKQKFEIGVNIDKLQSEISPVILSGSLISNGQGRMIVLSVGKLSRQGQYLTLCRRYPRSNILKQKLQAFQTYLSSIVIKSSIFSMLIKLAQLFLRQIQFLKLQSSTSTYSQIIINGCIITLIGSLPCLACGMFIGLLTIKYKIWNKDKIWVQYCEDISRMNFVSNIFFDQEEQTLQHSFEEWWNQQAAHFANIVPAKQSQVSERLSQQLQSEQNELQSQQQILQKSLKFRSAHYPAYPLPSIESISQIPNPRSPWKLFSKNTENIQFLYICQEGLVRYVVMKTYIETDSTNPLTLILGQSEHIMQHCDKMICRKTDQTKALDNTLRSQIRDATKSMNRRLASTYAVAYQNQIYDNVLEYIQSIEQCKMTFLCLLGGKSQADRSEHQIVRSLRQSGINSVLTTQKQNAIAMTRAKYIGIVSVQQQSLTLEGQNLLKISGQIICSICKHSICECSEYDFFSKQLKYLQKFSRISRYLKIAYQFSYWHKYVLQVGYRNMNQLTCCIAQTKDDLPALAASQVALASLDNQQLIPYANILLPHNSLQDLMKLLGWSRISWQFIRKYMQLTLTPCIVSVCLLLIGGMIQSMNPFSLGQLFWVNIGLCGLLAWPLSWQTPKQQDLKHNTMFSRDAPLMTELVQRQIISQSIWQILVLMMLLLTGHLYLPQVHDSIDDIIGSNWQAKYATQHRQTTANGLYSNPLLDTQSYRASYETYQIYPRHLTIVFNCYALMTIFNFFNCRQILQNKFNILQELSPFHVSIWLLSLLFHFGFISIAPQSMGLYPNGLTLVHWIISIGMALSVWIVGFIVRAMPPASQGQRIVFQWKNNALNLGVKLVAKSKNKKLRDFELEQDLQLKWQ